MLIPGLPAAGNVLFFHHTPAVCFLPASQASWHTHSVFDWHLALMIHTSPTICQLLSAVRKHLDSLFSLSRKGWYLNLSRHFLFCHLECLPAYTLQCRLLGYHARSTYRAVVQDSRMCGGNFTSLVIPGKLPRSPSISCTARLSLCVCACIQDCVCLFWPISRTVKAKTTRCVISSYQIQQDFYDSLLF